MNRWEYLTMGDNGYQDGLQKLLDELGPQGWELVTVNHRGVYIFKRPAGEA